MTITTINSISVKPTARLHLVCRDFIPEVSLQLDSTWDDLRRRA
jgi:hypothetical protein